MKLHLPTMLRRALLACFAAVSSVTFATGSAWADTYDLLASDANWTLGTDYSYADGSISKASSWGGIKSSVYSTGTSSYYTVKADNTLTFTIGFTSATNASAHSASASNSVLTFAWIGGDDAVVMGADNYPVTAYRYGTTINTAAATYGGSDMGLTPFAVDGTDMTRAWGVEYTLQGTVTLADGNYTLVMTLNDGTNTYTSDTIDLGDSFLLDRFVMSSAGGADTLTGLEIDGLYVECPVYTTTLTGSVDASAATWLQDGVAVNYSDIPLTGGKTALEVAGGEGGGTLAVSGTWDVHSLAVTSGTVALKLEDNASLTAQKVSGFGGIQMDNGEKATISGGVITVAGSILTSGSTAELTLANATLNLSGAQDMYGTLRITGASALAGGRLTIKAGSTLLLTDGSSLTRTPASSGPYWGQGSLATALNAVASFISDNDYHLGISSENTASIDVAQGSTLNMQLQSLQVWSASAINLGENATYNLTSWLGGNGDITVTLGQNAEMNITGALSGGGTKTFDVGIGATVDIGTLEGGGTKTFSGAGTVEIGEMTHSSATITLQDSVAVSTGRFCSASGDSTININDTSSLTVTGSNESNSNQASFLLGHWGSTVTINVNGGELVSTNALVRMGLDGTGHLSITNGGEADLKGLTFQTRDAYRGSLVLGAAEGGNATLKIGESGIAGVTGADVSVTLGNGTIEATADWEMTGNGTVNLVGTTGTTIDTRDHTVKIAPTLSGTGKLIKTGSGVLEIGAATTTLSDLTIQDGFVRTNAALSLTSLAVGDGAGFAFDLSAMGAHAGAAPVMASSYNGALAIAVQNVADGTYNLVQGAAGWDVSDIRLVEVSDRISVTPTIDGSGMLSIEVTTLGEALNLEWNADGPSDVWASGGDNNWYASGSNETFVNGDRVTFAGEGEIITVSGTVAPGEMTVSGTDYVFEGGTIAATGGLIVAESADAHIKSQASFAGGITVYGTLTITDTTTAENTQASLGMISGDGKVVLNLQENNGIGFDFSGMYGGNVNLNAGRLQLNQCLFTTDAGATLPGITLSNTGDLVFNGNVNVRNNVVIEGDIAPDVYVNSNVTDAKMYGSITGGDNATLRVQASGTWTLNGNVSVGTLSLFGATTKIASTVNVRDFSAAGGTITLENGATVTAETLRLSNERDCTSNMSINTGATMTVTGTAYEDSNQDSLMIAHWSGNSVLKLNGGEFDASGAVMQLSWTGKGTFEAISGTASVKGITFDAQSGNKGILKLGTADGTDALRVNIGSHGITNVQGDDVTFELGNGTLAATADWEMTGNGAVNLVGTTGTTIDTGAYTVKIAPTLSGTGKLIKAGSGVLEIGAATSTLADLSIQGGFVQTNAALALSALAVTDGAGFAYDLKAGVNTVTASSYNGAGAFTLVLSNVSAGTYNLFQGATGWDAAGVSFIDATTGEAFATGGRLSVAKQVSDAGLVQAVVSIANLADLTWNKAGGTDVWSAGADANWTSASATGDQQFLNGDSVVFGADNGEAITISGTVLPTAITVSGTGYSLVGEGSIGGSGKLTVANGGEITIGTANTYTGGTEIAAGGKLTITTAQALGGVAVAAGDKQYAGHKLGKVTGAGTLVLDTNSLIFAIGSGVSANLGGDVTEGDVTTPGFTGTVDIASGTLQIGSTLNQSGADSTVAFGAGKVIVRNGAMLTTHWGTGAYGNATRRDFTAAIDMMSGSELYNIDGCVEYKGAIRFNVADPSASTPTYDENGVVTIDQFYQKRLYFNGKLSGAGTVQLMNSEQEAAAAYILSGTANDFSGTFKLMDDNNTNTYHTMSDKVVELRLWAENTAQYADVELATISAQSKLMLGTSATINGLYGVAGNQNTVEASSGAFTLTVTEGDFGGKLANGSDANVLSLTKQGAVGTTLVLRGANSYTGATTIEGGTLEIAEGATMGTTEITVNALGALHVNAGTYTNSIKGSGQIYKMSSGEATLSGIAADFAGGIYIYEGTLNTGDSLSIAGDRTLHAVVSGEESVKLTSALTLGDGMLEMDYSGLSTPADAKALNLNDGVLTLAGGSTLRLTNLTQLDVEQGGVIDLFTGVGSLLGSDGNALELADGALASTYFSTFDFGDLDGSIDTATLGLQLADGKLQLVVPEQTDYLVWDANNSDWGTGLQFGDEAVDEFTADADVKFGELTADSETVTISDAVAAGKVLIDAGEGKTYVFSAAGDAAGIAAAESITVNSGTASFGAGTLDMTADTTLTVKDGATLSLANGAIANAGAVDIVLNDGGTLSFAADHAGTFASEVKVADGATVNLVNNNTGVGMELTNVVQGEGESATFNLSGGNFSMNASAYRGNVNIASGITVNLTRSSTAFAQNFSGDGGITIVASNGIRRLSGTNTYKGETALNGRLIIEGAQALSEYTTFTGTDALCLATAAGEASAEYTINRAFNTGNQTTYVGRNASDFDSAGAVTGVTLNLGSSATLLGSVYVRDGNAMNVAAGAVVGGTIGVEGNATLTLETALTNQIQGAGTVKVDGTGIVWDATGKSYTGTTALQANATVTTAGSLTTGANSKITLADGSQLTITGGLDSWTTGHTVSGTGTLVLDVNGTVSNVLEKLVASGTELSKMVVEDGTVWQESMGTGDGDVNVAAFNVAREIEVKSGATLELSGDISKSRSATNTITLSGGALNLGTASNTWLSAGINLQDDATISFGTNAVSLEGTNGDNPTKIAGNSHDLNLSSARTDAQVIDMAVEGVAALTVSGSMQFNRALKDVESLTVQSGTTTVNTGAFNSTDNKLDIADSITVAAGATLNMQASDKRHTDIVKNDGATDGGTAQDPTQIVALLSMGDGATLFRESGVVDLAGGLSVDGSVQLSTNWHKGMDISGLVSGDERSTINLVRTEDRDVQDLLVLKADNSVTYDEQDSTVQTGGFAGTWNVASNYRLRADHEKALADATVNLSWVHDTTTARHATLELKASTVNLKALQGVAGTNVKLYTPSPENVTNNGAVATTGSTLVISNEATSGNNFAGLLADGVNVTLLGGYQALSGTDQSGTHTFTVEAGVLDMSGYTREAVAATADGDDDGAVAPLPTVYDTIVALGGRVDGLNLGAGMLLTGTSDVDATMETITLGGSTVLGAGAMNFRVADSVNTIPGTETPYKLTNTLYTVGEGTGDSISLAGGSTKTLLNLSIVNALTEILDPTEENTGDGYRDHTLISGLTVAGLTLVDGVADASGYFTTNLDGVNTGSTKYSLHFVQKEGSSSLYDLVLRAMGAADTLFWNNAAGGTWEATDQTPDAWVKGEMVEGVLTPGTTTADFEQMDYVVFDDLTDGDAAVENVTITVADDGVQIGNMTVQADTTNYTFEGGAISSVENNTGATLTKTGTGTLTLTGANSYWGNTTITGGTVIAQNEAALSNTQVQIYGAGTWLVFDYDTAEGGDGVFDATVKLDGSGSNPGGSLRALKDATVNVLITGTNAPKDFHIATGKTLTLNALAAESGDTNLDGAFDINQEANGMSGKLKLQLANGRTYNHNKDTQVFAGEYIVSGNANTRLNDQALYIAQGATARVQGGMTLQITYLEGPLNKGYGKLVLEDASKLIYANASANHSKTLGNAIEAEGAELQIGGTHDATTTLTIKKDGLTLKDLEGASADNNRTRLTGGTWVLEKGAVKWDTDATTALALGASTTVKVNDDTMKHLRVANGGAVLTTAKASGSSALSVESILVTAGGAVQNVDLTITGTGSKIQGTVAGVTVNQTGTVDLNGTPALTFASAPAGDVQRASLASLSILSGLVQVPALTNPVIVRSGSVTINGANAALDLAEANKLTKDNGTTAVDITINAGRIVGAHTYNGLITVNDTGKALADGIILKNLSNSATVKLDTLTVSDTGMTTLKEMQGLTLADGSRMTLSSLLEEGQGNLLFDFAANPTGTLKLADGAKLTVDVNNVLGDVLDAATGSVSYTLADVDATGLAAGAVFDAALKLFNITSAWTTDGKLVLTRTAPPLGDDAIYRSSEDNVGADGTQWAGNGANVYSSGDAYTAVYIDKDTAIDLTQAAAGAGDGLVLSNLIGRGNGANLTITGNGDDKVTINSNLEPGEVMDNLRALSFNGDITVTGTELQLLNTVATPGAPNAGEPDAESVYQINGALKTDADSMVTITAGILKLNGKGSNAGELLGGVTVNGTQGQLQVSGEAALGGELGITDEDAYPEADLQLLKGGKVTLLDGAAVQAGFDIAGADTGTEILSVASGATASLAEETSVQDVVLDLQKDSTLNVDAFAGIEVDGLTGSGALVGGEKQVDNMSTWPYVYIEPQQESAFSGDLSGFDGRVEVGAGAGTQTFDHVSTSAVGTVDLVLGGKSIINVAEESGNKTLGLSALVLNNGSDTTVEMNTDSGDAVFSIQNGSAMEDGAVLTLSSAVGEVLSAEDDLLLMEGAAGADLARLDGKSITLDITDNAFRRLNETATLVVEGDKVYVDLTASETNRYEEGASDPNAKAGAELLWNVDPTKLPADSALKAIDSAVAELMQNGNRDAAERALAATAGAGTAVLGSAFSADVERQLRAIRNRTTTMGVNQCEVNEGMPYVNAWINAEGDHREMDADGLAAGYTMDSWGGTVGFDVDITNHLTMGMAVTAMYGDLEADSADRAEGDFDTQYVSLFARVAHQAWTHTFVATLGRADVTLNRTVSVPGGSYETSGDTDGMAYGFMYEVARTFSLSEDGTTCWQPVFNVAWRHSSIDAYTESGADNALAVGEQDMSVLTFGAGARLQTVLGESLYNRASIFEARAMVKVDAGDREGEADVALLEGTTAASVKSAEIGAVGVEIGAGVTIPVGLNAGSIFIDGSAEFRSGYSNVNGTVGYRINF